MGRGLSYRDLLLIGPNRNLVQPWLGPFLFSPIIKAVAENQERRA